MRAGKRAAAVLCGLCATIARLADAQGGAVQLRSQEPGRIRGVAFDSLRMIPLMHATISLLDGMESDTVNMRGQFDLKNVPPGSHIVALTSPELDSLGLGTLGTTINVPAGGDIRLNLATPSFRTIWGYRCANLPMLSADSGIVWGTVRDARTRQELSNARAQFDWYDFTPGQSVNALIKDVHKDVATDNIGTFVACGVPTDVRISTEASAPGTASGSVQYQVGLLRLQRMDLYVSNDMVIPDSERLATVSDSLAAQRARGRAMVQGVVLDYRKKPMADALVRIVATDTTVRTNKSGRFTLGGLPAGTQWVEIRRVGYAPFHQIVHLHPDSAAELTVQMPDVSALTTVNVRGSTTKGEDRIGYEQRRMLGLGHFVEPKDMGRKTDVGSILSMFKLVNVTRLKSGELVVWVPCPLDFRCYLPAYLDGVKTSWSLINMRGPDRYRAIEVYTNPYSVPKEFGGDGHFAWGAVVFWSANAHW